MSKTKMIGLMIIINISGKNGLCKVSYEAVNITCLFVNQKPTLTNTDMIYIS